MNHSTLSLSACFLLASLATASAATITWDGDAADGLWSSPTNWDGNTVPGGGDDVFISNGDSVAGIEFNSTFTLTLSGNSSLTDPVTSIAGGAWRAGGATVIVESGSTLGSGGFWDLDDATLIFGAGAVVNMGNWENKDTNNFTFELDATGFPTLTPNTFRIGNGGTHNPGSIANATYNVELANYTGGTGIITLVDYSSDAASMDNTTFQTAGGLNILNPGPYTANLQWNDTAESIELNITAVPEPSRALLLALGTLALIARRCRRR